MPPGVPGSEIKGQKPRWLSGGGGWLQPHPRHHELDTFFLAWSRSNVHTVMLTGRWGDWQNMQGLPQWPSGSESALQCRRYGFDPCWGICDPRCHRATKPTRPTMESTHSLQQKVRTEQQTSRVPPRRPSAAKQTGVKVEFKPGTLRSAHPPP